MPHLPRLVAMLAKFIMCERKVCNLISLLFYFLLFSKITQNAKKVKCSLIFLLGRKAIL